MLKQIQRQEPQNTPQPYQKPHKPQQQKPNDSPYQSLINPVGYCGASERPSMQHTTQQLLQIHNRTDVL